MTTENLQLELIQHLAAEKDPSVLDQIRQLLGLKKKEPKKGKRNGFGSGKDFILYVSPDFDAPLEDFKEYM